MACSQAGIEVAQESLTTWVVRTRGGRYVRVNDSTRRLIEALSSNTSLPSSPTTDEAKVIETIFEDDAALKRGHQYIKGRITLLSPRHANRVARFFKGLLRVRPGLIVGVMPAAAFFFLVLSLLGNPTPVIGAGYILVASLVLAGSLVHEMGHAAALAAFERDTKGIGFGFFIYVLPCFFADVSESWLLPRHQRIIISAAGCAFQTSFGIVLYAVGLLIQSEAFNSAILEAARLTFVLALFQLVPFYKSDGHWMLRDFLTETSNPKVRTLVRVTSAIGILLIALVVYRVFVGWKRLGDDIAYVIRTGYVPDGLYSMETIYTALATAMLLYAAIRSICYRVEKKRVQTRNQHALMK